MDKEIVFGIRTEDMHEAGTHHGVEESAEAELVVEVVEPMGNETFLYASTGLNPLKVRLRTKSAIKVQEKIKLIFNLAKVHFFDKDTDDAVVALL